jgi:membrane-associated phospholipid phosphatase
MPNLWTPPVPDYPSTHTVLGAAAATALAGGLGTDFVPFAMTSGGEYPGITRRFWSLSEAAHENGCSRVLAGIHFPAAITAGLIQGGQIGKWVADRSLRPREKRVAAR